MAVVVVVATALAGDAGGAGGAGSVGLLGKAGRGQRRGQEVWMELEKNAGSRADNLGRAAVGPVEDDGGSVEKERCKWVLYRDVSKEEETFVEEAVDAGVGMEADVDVVSDVGEGVSGTVGVDGGEPAEAGVAGVVAVAVAVAVDAVLVVGGGGCAWLMRMVIQGAMRPNKQVQ